LSHVAPGKRSTAAVLAASRQRGYRCGMRIVCANHGALPFTDAADEAAIAAWLGAQIAAGLDVVTDGQPGWSDPFTPLLAPLDGVRLGGPHQLPLGLSLARRPIVQAKLRRHRALLVDAFRRAAGLTTAPLKVTFTGPYTLAHGAEIATTAYHHPADLALDLAALLAQEVTALVAAGARYIQIDEPLLLARPDDAKLLRTVLEAPVDAAVGQATVIISTYGADAGACYAQLNTLPGDVIAIDCVGHPRVIEAIAETGSGKPLALGLVGANPADLDQLRALRDRLLDRYIHDTVWLQPARGLAQLSPLQAETALRQLTALR
jgi:5-methyltetrahydropteroyltriglutamate--homocysteine methyltransferase